MHAGKPDPEPARPAPSLAERLATVGRGRGPDAAPANRTTRWPGSLAALVAMLIVTGPLLTIGGAKLLEGWQKAAHARLEAEAQPRIEAARAATAAREQMDAVLRRRTLAATIEALARALPADATLVRAERTAQGALELEIAAPDPDRLRAALRRVPALARLRNTGQRQADTRIIVVLSGNAQ